MLLLKDFCRRMGKVSPKQVQHRARPSPLARSSARSVTALASASLTAPWGEATSIMAGMGIEVWVSGHPGGGSGSAGHGQRFVSAALPRREEDEDALEAAALL